MKIRRERPSQRLHHRIDMSIRIDIGGRSYRSINWSLGGFCIGEFGRSGKGEMPIVALTSSTKKQDRKKCLAAGMNDHVAKPVRKKEIFGALDRWVSGEAAEGQRILLADDDTSIRKVVRAMFKKTTHTLDVVKDGREAVEAVRTERYDFILMDLSMPVMDGFEATAGPCQRKIACPAGVLILASLDEKPIPIFQDIARSYPPCCNDVYPLPPIVAAGRGLAP